MAQHIKHLLKDIIGYSLHSFIGPLFTLLLTPIYTRVLADASVYGVVDILTMTGSILFTIGLLGINQAIMPLYHDAEHEQPTLILSAFLMVCVWISLLVGSILIFAEPLSSLLFDRDDLAGLLGLIAISQWFFVFYTLCGSILRLKHQVKRANILAIGYVCILAATNILFVVVLRWGAQGVVVAQMCTHAAVACLGIYLIRLDVFAKVRSSYIHQLAKLGLPLVPAAFSGWLLMYEDRFFLTRLATYEEIGIYSIAIKLASMISVALMAFKFAWLPFAMSIKNEPDAPKVYARVLIYYAMIGFVVALALSLFSHEILLVFTTSDYIEAQRYIWLMAFMSLSEGFQIIVTTGLYVTKKLGSQVWIVAVAAVVNTLLNALLIPFWGILGAAIATATAYTLVAILNAFSAQKVYKVQYEWGKVIRLCCAYLIISGVSASLVPYVSFKSLGLRIGLFSLFILFMLSNMILSSDERQRVFRAIRQPKQFVAHVLKRS